MCFLISDFMISLVGMMTLIMDPAIIYHDSTGTKAFPFQSTSITVDPTTTKQPMIATLKIPLAKFIFELTLLYPSSKTWGWVNRFNFFFLYIKTGPNNIWLVTVQITTTAIKLKYN